MRRFGGFVLALLLAGPSMGQDIGLSLTEPAPYMAAQTGQALRSDITGLRPARLLVIGDSLAQGFGFVLETRVPELELLMSVRNDARISTGLSRADFYDWPAHFAQMAAEQHPDIVVIHFGSNDMQAILADGGRTVLRSAEWEVEYRRQIRKILEIAARHQIVTYWLGPAPDKHRNLNAHLTRINPWIAQEAAAAGAVYLPLSPLAAAPDGSYARVVGGAVLRTGDGSHFTARGYRLVVDHLLAEITARYPQLAPSPVDLLAQVVLQ